MSKIEINNIKIGKSAITDEIFAGITNKDNMSWKHKVDVTAYFLKAVVDRFCGFTETFRLGGIKYTVTCRRLNDE